MLSTYIGLAIRLYGQEGAGSSPAAVRYSVHFAVVVAPALLDAISIGDAGNYLLTCVDEMIRKPTCVADKAKKIGHGVLPPQKFTPSSTEAVSAPNSSIAVTRR